MSVWCVLECSVNFFTSSTLFGKVDTHFYLIGYELHVSDTDVFFLFFSLIFAIKQIVKKKKIQLKSADYGCSITKKFFV